MLAATGEESMPQFYNNAHFFDSNVVLPELQFAAAAPPPNHAYFYHHHHQNFTPSFLGFYEGVTQEPAMATGFVVVPKNEPENWNFELNSRIGLNLGFGGRTYFSSSDDDFVNFLYRRSRLFDSGSFNAPRCQAQGCNADLTYAKHYHRRHKVCEFHSKAATVITAGLTQRFCQQCSRFHLLSEFDNGKRSCRRRLADHNRRRRKPPQSSNQENSTGNNTQKETPPIVNSSENPTRSPVDSPAVTLAATPPRISLDSQPFGGGTLAPTSALFYSNY